MRRLPVALWLLAPLAVGLLYAAGHALLSARPDAGTLAPAEALLVQRFRHMKAVDRCAFGPRTSDLPAPRDAIAEACNVPGLPGVDLDGPLHMILMPRTIRHDSTLVVFALSDEDAFERAFERPDLIESGGTRHAQHLVVRGSWAAVGPSRDAARRIGTGGLTAADLGEDHALVVDVPRLAQHAISLAGEPPWRPLLLALGVDVEAASTEVDPEERVRVVTLPGMERVLNLGEVWKTARMWVWMDPGRLRVDLEPQPGPLREALRRYAAGRPAEAVVPPVPADAQIRLYVPDGAAAALLLHALSGCGVRLPSAALGPVHVTDANLGDATVPGGLLVWAVPAPGPGSRLTLGLAAAHRRVFDRLDAFLPLPQGDEDGVPLPEGAAPLTLGSPSEVGPSTAGEVRRGLGGGYAFLTLGAGARHALERVRANPAPNRALDPPTSPEPDAEGLVRLAEFAMTAERARLVLGRALEPGGFLASLAGGDVHGRLLTDGELLRLEARVRR